MKTVSIVIGALMTVGGFANPLAAGSVLDRIKDHGIIVAATDPTWPPFSWRDPIGEYHGFDVEVTREIADRLGVRAEFVTPPWEEQVAGGWGDGWDIAVTNMTPTADRAQRLAFPAIYIYGQAALAVRADDESIAAPADAGGRKIAVIEDTVYNMYLRRQDFGVVGAAPVRYQIESPEVVEYAVSGPNYLALSEGRVDAVLDDLLAINGQILQGRELRIVGEPLFSAPAAVAIDQGDPEFAAEVARIVEEMHADGTLSDLSARWFDIDVSVAPEQVSMAPVTN